MVLGNDLVGCLIELVRIISALRKKDFCRYCIVDYTAIADDLKGFTLRKLKS